MEFIKSLKRLLEKYDFDDEKEALAEFEGADVDEIRGNLNHKYKIGRETYLVFKDIEKAKKEAYDRVYNKVKSNYKNIDWYQVGGFKRYLTDNRIFKKLQKELITEELNEYIENKNWDSLDYVCLNYNVDSKKYGYDKNDTNPEFTNCDELADLLTRKIMYKYDPIDYVIGEMGLDKVFDILEEEELIDDEQLIEDILDKTPLVDILSPDRKEEDIIDYEGNTYYIYRL